MEPAPVRLEAAALAADVEEAADTDCAAAEVAGAEVDPAELANVAAGAVTDDVVLAEVAGDALAEVADAAAEDVVPADVAVALLPLPQATSPRTATCVAPSRRSARLVTVIETENPPRYVCARIHAWA